MLNLMTESIISVKASRPHCQEGCLYEGGRISLKSEDADISYLACIMLNFRITTFCASSSLKNLLNKRSNAEKATRIGLKS